MAVWPVDILLGVCAGVAQGIGGRLCHPVRPRSTQPRPAGRFILQHGLETLGWEHEISMYLRSPFMKLPIFLTTILAAAGTVLGDDLSSTNSTAVLPETAVPTIVTNVVEVNPVIDLDSFPVERLSKDIESKISTIQAEATAAQDARNKEQFDTVARRLDVIEGSIKEQRGHELSLLDRMQRFTLFIAVAFAALGMIGMAVIGIMLWKSNSRLAEVAAGIPQMPRLGGGTAPAGLLPQENAQQYSEAGESSKKLMGALTHLQSRIEELEHTSTKKNVSRKKKAPQKASDAEIIETNGNGNGHHDNGDVQFDSLIAKGDTQMNLGDFKTALMCYEQASQLEPENADAQLKKGNALERLRKIEEAIECYDRAIALDSNLTLAFLHKGRAFNRISRFDEALECYERALKTQSQ